MQQQPGEVTGHAEQLQMPSHLREISALSSRLRILIEEAQDNKHTFQAPVYQYENALRDDSPRTQTGTVLQLRGDWHTAYRVVMQRLGTLLGLDVHLADAGKAYSGEVTSDWIGDGWMIGGARSFVRVAEMLLADYRATFEARA